MRRPNDARKHPQLDSASNLSFHPPLARRRRVTFKLVHLPFRRSIAEQHRAHAESADSDARRHVRGFGIRLAHAT